MTATNSTQTASRRAPQNNLRVARLFREAADLLEQQGDENPFRTAAYRRGARVIERLDQDVGALYAASGEAGLRGLRSIGASLAATIAEVLETGKWETLSGLRDEGAAHRVFEQIPGIGPDLAKRLSETLGIETLEALQSAAERGQLERVPGIGPQRARALQLMLIGLMTHPPLQDDGGKAAPGVEVLLAVDLIYRARAEHGELPRVTPRRFNPEGKAWLPVMSINRSGYRFLVRFSNTARAHSTGSTQDWVVIDYASEQGKGQCTVVTEVRGELEGQRVVRGREPQCHAYYQAATAPLAVEPASIKEAASA